MKIKRILNVFMAMMLAGCAQQTPSAAQPSAAPSAAPPAAAETPSPEPETIEKNGDIVVLYTSDIHCGLLQGFGVIGLHQIRRTMEANGTTTLLVDDGDAVQGDYIGTLTEGEAIVQIMNDLQYDVAIPGNHEFDYGMEQFLKLTEMADFPYISCNFNKEGELVFDPYIIKEAAGKKIAFIGVTTPYSVTSSTPKYFQNEDGEFIYGFLRDEDGTLLFETIQKYVDEVREKGADYVVLQCHIGNEEAAAPYNFQTIIENTSGIDVLLDGHSHDTDQVTMNDRDGHPVIRSACGTKLQAVGYMKISGEDGSVSCGIYNWNNDVSVPELLGIHNEMDEPTAKLYADLEEITNTVIGSSDAELTINDPEKTKEDGSAIRIVRSQETNLGDLAADALRYRTDSEIGIVNGGGLRVTIGKGEITYGDIIKVMPYNNSVCVSKVSGAALLDALEWGSRRVPEETGGFLQVSGLSFEINAGIPSPCVTDLNGMFGGVQGERRVKNVMVNGEPLDLQKEYTVAGTNYILKNSSDGYSMFTADDVILDSIQLDNQAVIEYIQEELGGVVKEPYTDPYGEGRIRITGIEE